MLDKTTRRRCSGWTLLRALLLSTVLGIILPWPNSGANALPYGSAGIELDEENEGISLTACYVEDLRNIREHSQNPLVIEINHCYLQELPNAIFIRFNDLKVLEICDSRVNNLQDFALNGLRNIESLNLSRNNLTTIKSWSDHDLDTLQVLDLRRNLIRSIDESSFHRYPSLVKLNLAVNLITTIPDGTFKPIINLKNLNMGKNLLTTIAEGMLRGLNKLTHVALHHNRIRTIHPFAFVGNSHLKVVQLQGNQLGSFEPDLLGNLPRLQFLNVSSNELETIGNLSFKNNGDLKMLDLSYNRIRHLEDHSLKGLYDLEALNISHNQLETVSKHVLKDCGNLRDLDLSSNMLDYVSLKLSILTPRLVRLNLSSNAISEIERDVFEDLPKLHTLDLAHNQLTDDNFLWPLMNLSVLNMSRNGFRRINASLLESLTLAELYDNPWDCRFLVQELVHHSSNVIYGKNYLVEDTGRILTATGIECTDERGKHRDIVVVEPPRKPTESELEFQRYKFFHEGHVDTRPIQDNFDTKSTVIWLMSGAIAVFGAFKLIQLLLRHSEHQSEKWRLAQHVSSDEDHEEAARQCSSRAAVSCPISTKSATSSGFNFFLNVPNKGCVRQYTPTIK